MNAPARYELFVLEDGEKAVEVFEDSKIPNAATIKIVKQDHTLGNMLRAYFKREFTFKDTSSGEAAHGDDPYGGTNYADYDM
ncbi:DNA-directed RNA polymerase II [Coprinopsis sp. MPI-PUGE-AT-0042]|nr:DNA-directed RNA polymerase II [Coprinopsis sp. MPI-PUGE-AT-0042]